MLGNFWCFFVICWFFYKINIDKKSLRITIRVSNSLNPDVARNFVRPYLGPNCMGQQQPSLTLSLLVVALSLLVATFPCWSLPFPCSWQPFPAGGDLSLLVVDLSLLVVALSLLVATFPCWSLPFPCSWQPFPAGGDLSLLVVDLSLLVVTPSLLVATFPCWWLPFPCWWRPFPAGGCPFPAVGDVSLLVATTSKKRVKLGCSFILNLCKLWRVWWECNDAKTYQTQNALRWQWKGQHDIIW